MYIVYYRYSKYHLHKLSTHLPSSSSWNLPGNFFQKKTTSQQNTIPGGRFLQSRAEVLRSIARHETFVLDYQTMNVTPWVGRNSWRKLMGNHESGGGKSVNLLKHIFIFLGGVYKKCSQCSFLMYGTFTSNIWFELGSFSVERAGSPPIKQISQKKFRFLICLDSASPTQLSGLWSADKYT